jgi:hypothetical protein
MEKDLRILPRQIQPHCAHQISSDIIAFAAIAADESKAQEGLNGRDVNTVCLLPDAVLPITLDLFYW